jgi:hypothetical protein
MKKLTEVTHSDYILAMQLRDHPLMSYRTVRNWPPTWTRSGEHIITGEIGILKQVNGDSALCNRCFLVIEHKGLRYVGALLFSDVMFCLSIRKLLKNYIGQPIKEIGDLDLSFIL